jgi:thioredoxin-like negative regulator of GroEL
MTSKSRRQQIEEMLAEDPDDPFLRYGLAMEYVSGGEHEAAAGCFRELLRLHPDYVPAYFHSGKTLIELGQEEEARAVLRAGIAAASRKGDAHAAGEMGMLLDGMG